MSHGSDRRSEIELEGKDGYLQQPIKASMERGLKNELSKHLGCEHCDSAGRMVPNSSNAEKPGQEQLSHLASVTVTDINFARIRPAHELPGGHPGGSNHHPSANPMTTCTFPLRHGR